MEMGTGERGAVECEGSTNGSALGEEGRHEARALLPCKVRQRGAVANAHARPWTLRFCVCATGCWVQSCIVVSS